MAIRGKFPLYLVARPPWSTAGCTCSSRRKNRQSGRYSLASHNRLLETDERHAERDLTWFFAYFESFIWSWRRVLINESIWFSGGWNITTEALLLPWYRDRFMLTLRVEVRFPNLILSSVRIDTHPSGKCSHNFLMTICVQICALKAVTSKVAWSVLFSEFSLMSFSKITFPRQNEASPWRLFISELSFKPSTWVNSVRLPECLGRVGVYSGIWATTSSVHLVSTSFTWLRVSVLYQWYSSRSDLFSSCCHQLPGIISADHVAQSTGLRCRGFSTFRHSEQPGSYSFGLYFHNGSPSPHVRSGRSSFSTRSLAFASITSSFGVWFKLSHRWRPAVTSSVLRTDMFQQRGVQSSSCGV